MTDAELDALVARLSCPLGGHMTVAECDKQRAEAAAALTTLRKQRDELREALLPFAELAGDVSMNDPLRKWLTVAHLVDARQALSNMEGE